MRSDKEIPTCPQCGGTDVKVDAWATWDVEEQQWELHSTYENYFCEDCEETISSLQWKEMEVTVA